MIINRKQLNLLQGFYAHRAAVNFDNATPDNAFYADILDKAGVSWAIQNLIAEAAECRNNVYGLYFKTVLKNNGIEINLIDQKETQP